MSKQVLCAFAILLLCASQSSCILFRKGTKRAASVADTAKNVAGIIDTAKPGIGAHNINDGLINSLMPYWMQQPLFSTFSAKAKMHYEGKGQKQEFTTIFRIKKNEVIWASVTALGGIVQVARIYITPDSFKLINYLGKEVTLMPLTEVNKLLPAPADFSTLQSLIIGGALGTEGRATDAVDLGNILSLQVEEKDLVQQINYAKKDTAINTLQMRSKIAGGPSGMISFSDYQNIDGRKFSMSRSINVVNAGEQYNLDMNFNKANFDQPVDFPFSVPKNYKRK